MNGSPLQLGNCYFTEIRISSRSDAKDDETNLVDVTVEAEAFKRAQETPRQWFVDLRVKINPKEGAKPGYFGEVDALGTFEVDPGWPEDQIEKLVSVNGAGMIYGAIRELVCNLTARGFWNMLVLPTYSFVEHYKKQRADREQAKKTEEEATA